MRRFRFPLAAPLVAVALLVACDRTAAPVVTPTPTPSAASPTSADAVAARLCTRPDPLPATTTPAEGTVPPVIRETMAGVERVRGLDFLEPVVPDPQTEEELSAGVRAGLKTMYPAELFGRRSLAWSTIGAIPVGTRIDREVAKFGDQRVVGYYDTLSKQLVFLGSSDPSPGERVTLAHELTHALEDQHFDLSRIDRMLAACDDEAFQAALAVVEGSANHHMYAFAEQELTARERRAWQSEGYSGGPGPVDPFVEGQLYWPYIAGQDFVDELEREGGQGALDGALATLPASTEQVLHPSAYPSDLPVAVDVPDLGPSLGASWTDLDVMETGEAWLSALMQLRLDSVTAEIACAGWGGARYRAWTDGTSVAVLLVTTWDTPEDARQFADGMDRWIVQGSSPAAVGPVDGSTVEVWFATDGATLDALRAASA